LGRLRIDLDILPDHSRHRPSRGALEKTRLFQRAAAASSYEPRYADIVVDANTGDVLHSVNADATRHPASLTKIMTLYLLFERLESGRLRLDSRLEVSENATEQAPTKLGVKAGKRSPSRTPSRRWSRNRRMTSPL
jgi:D-alanyl-D-alanine carboxypeptidase